MADSLVFGNNYSLQTDHLFVHFQFNLLLPGLPTVGFFLFYKYCEYIPQVFCPADPFVVEETSKKFFLSFFEYLILRRCHLILPPDFPSQWLGIFSPTVFTWNSIILLPKTICSMYILLLLYMLSPFLFVPNKTNVDKLATSHVSNFSEKNPCGSHLYLTTISCGIEQCSRV